MRRAILLLLMLAMAFGSASPAAAKRVALVIGNSGYEQIATLKNPKNDADAVAAVLTRLGFEVVKGTDLTHDAFAQTVRDFSRALAGANTAVLFYAGHGLRVGDRNYLAPVDARLENEADLDFEMVQVETILAQMEREPRVNIVLLDACRDNPLARNLARSMGTRSAAIGRGLARIESGIGTLIAFATQPGNVALDGEGAHSPFTAALLKHIETPGLDVAALMRQVRQEVITATSNRQVPWDHSSLTASFVFNPAATGPQQQAVAPSASAPAPQPPAPDPALAAWNATKDTTSVSVLEAFIAKFGDSFYATLAKAKLADLKKEEETKVAVVTPPETPVAPTKPVEPAVVTVPNPQGAPHHKPGETFRDCPDCPEMVVVPAGKFMMGSPPDEKGRGRNESPQHEVTMAKPFAIGKFEVTRDQFEAFVKDSGPGAGSECFTHAQRRASAGAWGRRDGGSYRNPGYQQGGNEPVTCVNWDDAKAYAAWLSKKTGKDYRLLSEAEWEYAARAGSQLRLASARSEGDLCRYANGADLTAKKTFKDWTVADCSDGYAYTAPVGSFAPNDFGLYDMQGNVWEWVEDCHHDSYAGAPADSSAWTSGTDCGRRRVLRGGSFGDGPGNLRSAYRLGFPSDLRGNNLGLRVARTL